MTPALREGIQAELDRQDQAGVITWDERIDAILALVGEVVPPCGTCGGAPHASGKVCVCGGKNTVYAEVEGLRAALNAEEEEGARYFVLHDKAQEEVTRLRAALADARRQRRGGKGWVRSSEESRSLSVAGWRFAVSRSSSVAAASFCTN